MKLSTKRMIMLFDESKFSSKEELFKFLRGNKTSLLAQKKATIKYADNASGVAKLFEKDGSTTKANEPFTPDSDTFKVRVAINTTNLFDSHNDVHIKGLWKKSLSENKSIMHLQEHRRSFENIISSELNAFTKTFSWKELGFDFEGSSEALLFDSTLLKSRNEFMFNQYAKGWVKEHSVGMRYIKLVLAINDENSGAEFEAWEKYIPEVANREDAERKGFMWVVKEAKVLEGSAVPMGSNWATPTLDNNLKNQPLKDTGSDNEEPLKNTQINYDYLLKKI